MSRKFSYKIVSAVLSILFILPALCPAVLAANEDTANTELTGYISQNIDEVTSKFKNMVNNHATTGISYQNSSVVFESFENKKICFVEINEACPYTLFGIGYGKDMSSAMDILTRKGWKLKESNEIATASLQALVDGTGNWVINLYSVGKKKRQPDIHYVQRRAGQYAG